DVKGHRIFVAALGNNTVEVLDTQGTQRRSISGLGEPQGVLYLPDSNRLFIANGGADRLDVVDAAALSVLKRVGGLSDADNVRYDGAAGRVLVGYGHGALKLVEPQTGELTGDIALPGHPESFQLEQHGTRAFVNVPSAHRVVVVDRTSRKRVAEWPTGNASSNYPMALDEASHRLFVGARSPAELLVYDTQSGKIVAALAIGRDTDDLFFDARRKRIYAICGEGRVDVIRQDSPDRYVSQESIKTASRARTGLFVPEESRLYVAAPADGASSARVLVFEAR
ncbi:MAG: YncE family protein, partial [Bacillota bacterium]